MNNIAIDVSQLWKKFRRGGLHDSLRDLLPALGRRLIGGGAKWSELEENQFWALKDVSFQVRPGEALGVIGPNGAGKSTLLKLLTRILRPNNGRIAICGRVGALIEVAAGFHPDLTGRENIYLQGTVMGMKQDQIRGKFEEIVEFSGVSEFIDTPMKRYSSGMQARLGFAIVAHINPDVLLIDEVLAVGDMAFQVKCIKRMKEFKRQGVAIVFVSHNIQAVADLCDSGLYLHREIVAQGPAHEIIGAYLRGGQNPDRAVGGGVIRVAGAELLNEDKALEGPVKPGQPLVLRAQFVIRESVSDLTLGFIVYRSTDNLVVYDGNIHGHELGLHCLRDSESLIVDFAFRAHLTRGQYHVECLAFYNQTQQILARLCPAGVFSIQDTRTQRGVANLDVVCTVVERTPGAFDKGQEYFKIASS